MASSKTQSPKLGKSQALNIAQGTVTRLATIVPTLTTELSPSTVYQPGGTVGGELLATPSFGPSVVSNAYGVWVAPDLYGNGLPYTIQVECFGGGGGGGGGSGTRGGGGGGGASYGAEYSYPVVPGQSYAYVVGLPGSGGYCNSTGVQGSAGTNGGTTVFDLAGVGLAGGVQANGGVGADQTAIGSGGAAGAASGNTESFAGGNGATNNSANGSDYPLVFAQTSGMFVGNTLNPFIIPCWYIMNDSNFQSPTRNDSSDYGNNGTWTNFNGYFETTGVADAPTQAPAYTSNAGVWGPNQTTAGWASQFACKSITAPAARFKAPSFAFSGNKLTVSCWVQAPSQATWGNTVSGSVAIIATNSENPTGNGLKGYSLYAHQTGTTASPSWSLTWAVGNGTVQYHVTDSTFTATPGTWYYVVGTFNANLLTLYVNAVSIGTATASFTSVPSGAYSTTLGCDPVSKSNWFFGLISNIWWANDCATSTLVSQAFGLTPATGGSGGGASGGSGGAGGAGAAGSGSSGGVGGTPADPPNNLYYIAQYGQEGFAGGNAGAGGGTSSPVGGPYGAGGAGSGTKTSPLGVSTFTIPFSTAATYCGTDATSTPDSPYNTNQQTNPATGLTSVLFSGGAAADVSSGSKNSIMLLPKGVAAELGSGNWTVTQVTITFTNAYPTNTIESVLEIGYSADTTLPQLYSGASLVKAIGAVPIAAGAGTITYDLTQTGIGTNLANGTCTAFILGPGATPTFNAYNAVCGPQFYASIYGPGAADTSGNQLYPYLTVTVQKTKTVQTGSIGGPGAILISAIQDNYTPVATMEPYPTTDSNGNQFAEGFTGPTQNWNPLTETPGSFEPEVWHAITFAGGSPAGTTGYVRVKRLAESNFCMLEMELIFTGAIGADTTYGIGSLPSSMYYPLNTRHAAAACTGTIGVPDSTYSCPRVFIPTSGPIQYILPQGATGVACNVMYAVD